MKLYIAIAPADAHLRVLSDPRLQERKLSVLVSFAEIVDRKNGLSTLKKYVRKGPDDLPERPKGGKRIARVSWMEQRSRLVEKKS